MFAIFRVPTSWEKKRNPYRILLSLCTSVIDNLLPKITNTIYTRNQLITRYSEKFCLDFKFYWSKWFRTVETRFVLDRNPWWVTSILRELIVWTNALRAIKRVVKIWRAVWSLVMSNSAELYTYNYSLISK